MKLLFLLVIHLRLLFSIFQFQIHRSCFILALLQYELTKVAHYILLTFAEIKIPGELERRCAMCQLRQNFENRYSIFISRENSLKYHVAVKQLNFVVHPFQNFIFDFSSAYFKMMLFVRVNENCHRSPMCFHYPYAIFAAKCFCHYFS